jgi:glycosyltransferase involved in cell wall biosynthesis
VVSVNNCTDNTEDILADFSDPRLRIVRPQEFLEMSDNWRFCIEHSRGDYVNLLSSDDILLPDYAIEQSTILDEHPHVSLAYCSCKLIDSRGKFIGLEQLLDSSSIRPGPAELRRYLRYPRCFLLTVLMRRESYERAGGFGSWKMVGDWDLWLRLLQQGDAAYNRRVLAYYRIWDDVAGTRSYENRLLTHVTETAKLYNLYEPLLLKRYPDWARDFRRARNSKALEFVFQLSFISDFEARAAISREICDLANSQIIIPWLVKWNEQLSPLFKVWLKVEPSLRYFMKYNILERLPSNTKTFIYSKF